MKYNSLMFFLHHLRVRTGWSFPSAWDKKGEKSKEPLRKRESSLFLWSISLIWIVFILKQICLVFLALPLSLIVLQLPILDSWRGFSLNVPFYIPHPCSFQSNIFLIAHISHLADKKIYEEENTIFSSGS